MFPNMQYFESLKKMIDQRLNELAKSRKISRRDAKSQIKDYPWLYGALGKVPADVMFICENPSLAGIKKAQIDTIDGGPADIEAQWWGGSHDNAACRFRVALYKLNLKTTPPEKRGGWECYITNVIKQANIAKDQERLPSETRVQQARNWADILQWELNQVKPKYLFCVGEKAYEAVKRLKREEYLDINLKINSMTHYSSRSSHKKVIDAIVTDVQKVINPAKSQVR